MDFQVILNDSIIIFDEAHNVSSAAEEGKLICRLCLQKHLADRNQLQSGLKFNN